MSYVEYDQSVQNADPVLLVVAEYAGTTYRFTDQPRDYVFGGNTYQAVNGFTIGPTSQTKELVKDILQLDFPINNTFANIFLNDLQDFVTSITAFRGYANDPDQEFIVYWKGRIASAGAASSKITIRCEPIFTSLRRPGLRARYQRNCRHALYDRGCNLDLNSSAFLTDGTITVASNLTFTIPEAAGEVDGFYFGGILRASDGILRFITGHVGDQISIRKPHVALVVSAAVALAPGCDRTTNDCLNKFNNLNNFGGFPYIPTKNPFGGSSIL